jgi:hypothetical protein
MPDADVTLYAQWTASASSSRQTGVRADTYKRIIIDSGAVYKNFVSVSSLGTLIGATRGGNVFKVETEQRLMEVDGAHGPVKGGKRNTNIVVTLTANFIEITKELLAMTQPGSSTTAVGTTHNKITRTADILAADYVTNVAIVGNVTGTTEYVVCVVKNTLADGSLEVSFTDKDEGVIAANFIGHFDPDALDTEPWDIYWPIVSSSSSSSSSSASSSASAS